MVREALRPVQVSRLFPPQLKGGLFVLAVNLDDPLDRTAYFLALCDSDRKHRTGKVGNNFIANLERAFAELNRPIEG